MKIITSTCFILSGLIFIAFLVHGFYAMASKNYMTFDQTGMYVTACFIFIVIGGMIEAIREEFIDK